MRVPLYPLIIEVCQALFGDTKGLSAVCAIQFIVSYISVIFFYRSLCLIGSHTNVNLLFTIIYACSAAVIGWDKTILTESLALSFSVFLIYFLIRYCYSETHSAHDNLLGFCIAIITFLGTFLRPTFSSFMIIAFGFFIIRAIVCKNERLRALKYAMFMLLPIFAVLSYAFLFYTSYDSFTLSDTWCTQQLYISIENGWYQNATDDEIVDFIDEQLAYYGYPEVALVSIGTSEYGEPNAVRTPVSIVTLSAYKKFEKMRISELIKETVFKDLKDYIVHITKTFLTHYNDEFIAIMTVDTSSFSSLLSFAIANLFLPSFSFGNGLVMAFLMCSIWLAELIKRKEFDWICFGCFGFILSQYVLSLFGTFAEFSRTAIAVVPFVILSFFILVNKLFSFFYV